MKDLGGTDVMVLVLLVILLAIMCGIGAAIVTQLAGCG